MGSFDQSYFIADIFARLAALEADAGLGNPDNWYADAADLRTETSHTDGDWAGIVPSYTYLYDDDNTESDDGLYYIKPNDVGSGAGRWVLQAQFSVVGHTHDEKADLPAGAVENNIASFDDQGKLKDSGDPYTDLVHDGAYIHTDNNFDDDYKAILDNLPDFDPVNKMNLIEAAPSNAGKFPKIKSDGNLEASIEGEDDILHYEGVDNRAGSSYPYTINVDLKTIDVNTISAFVFATLAYDQDSGRVRSVACLINFDNKNLLNWMPLGENADGDEFDGDIDFSIVDDNLRMSYTQTDGTTSAKILVGRVILNSI